MTANTLPVPARVARFYGTVEFAIDVMQNKRITFVHASQLNDPFDPYGFFETDFGDSYSNLVKYVREKHPADLPWFRASVTVQSWGTTVIELKAYMKRLRGDTFVLSTCAASPDLRPEHNLYMWGHYANGHRGIALEFNTDALARAVLKHHADMRGNPLAQESVWAQIEYAKSFSPISAEYVFQFMKQEKEIATRRRAERALTDLDRYYNRMATIKSDVWQREHEWRLMWRNDETEDKIYKCPIGEDAITAVYLGMILDPDSREKIASAMAHNFPGVPILQARKRHGDLALEFSSSKAR
jgi:hypothetical protein